MREVARGEGEELPIVVDVRLRTDDEPRVAGGEALDEVGAPLPCFGARKYREEEALLAVRSEKVVEEPDPPLVGVAARLLGGKVEPTKTPNSCKFGDFA